MALVARMNKLISSLEIKIFIAISSDFSKAFDAVHDDVILYKLSHMEYGETH